MNKERDSEREREISARIARANAKEREIVNRHKLVEEDRLSAEASGSALHKDQSRYETYLYVPPHQRMNEAPEEEDGDRRRNFLPREGNSFSPLHDDRDRPSGHPRRGRGQGPRRGARGGRGGPKNGGGPQFPTDQKWLDERAQADSARLDANKTADGSWKREFDRGKKIPFASTRSYNEEHGEQAPRPRFNNSANRGRGRGGGRRGSRGAPEFEDRPRQVLVQDDAMMVTVTNDCAPESVGPQRGGARQRWGPSRSSESSVEGAGEGSHNRGRVKNGFDNRRGGERRRGNRRHRRAGHSGHAGEEHTGVIANGKPASDANARFEQANFIFHRTEPRSDSPNHLSDGGLVGDVEVEDEYIDDTLEDLEDLDQYRLKIDLNEFTVDNPDLPDPILKKPMEFSWARAVSEEEKCQARGETAPQYSGPIEVVWYDELEGDKCTSPTDSSESPIKSSGSVVKTTALSSLTESTRDEEEKEDEVTKNEELEAEKDEVKDEDVETDRAEKKDDILKNEKLEVEKKEVVKSEKEDIEDEVMKGEKEEDVEKVEDDKNEEVKDEIEKHCDEAENNSEETKDPNQCGEVVALTADEVVVAIACELKESQKGKEISVGNGEEIQCVSEENSTDTCL